MALSPSHLRIAPVRGNRGLVNTARLRRLGGRRAFVLALAVFVVDQVTKRIARSSITPGHEVPFIGPLRLVNWHNDGVAFSRFAGEPWIVAVLVLLAATAIVVYAARTIHLPNRWIAAGLLLGGASGNIADRLSLGAVIDFLRVDGGLAFNLADVAIVAGGLAIAAATRTARGDA